jgi:PIN domain nuclease of toxin-antitoxin system
LSKAAREAITDGKNAVYVSAAVAWEIAIKRSLGKLDAPDDLEAAMEANRFLPLPVTGAHALAVQTLADHHRDPFDRLLIAQAQLEGFKLVSRDPYIPRYGVPHIVAWRRSLPALDFSHGPQALARASQAATRRPVARDDAVHLWRVAAPSSTRSRSPTTKARRRPSPTTAPQSRSRSMR